MKLGKTVTITFTVMSHSTDGEELDRRTGSVQLESEDIYTQNTWSNFSATLKNRYMAKFDLERFKAGEAALGPEGQERHYVGFSTKGILVVENFRGDVYCVSLETTETWTMKPEEEWILLTSHVFGSKKEAEEYNSAHGLGYDVVRIVRD